jgi:hypothetical protein
VLSRSTACRVLLRRIGRRSHLAGLTIRSYIASTAVSSHLAAAYRVLAYAKGTLHHGLSYHNPGAGKRNKLSDWVDSDFAFDIDTRKSLTGYLMVLNGSPVSGKASRQGGVTLSSSEAECVAAIQAGQEVLLWKHIPRHWWMCHASAVRRDNADAPYGDPGMIGAT